MTAKHACNPKVLLFVSLFVMLGGVSMAVVADHVSLDKVCALYGVDPGAPPLEGKTPEEKAEFIASLGANAVFGGYKDEEFAKACKARGIAVYASLGLFQGAGEDLFRVFDGGGHDVGSCWRFSAV